MKDVLASRARQYHDTPAIVSNAHGQSKTLTWSELNDSFLRDLSLLDNLGVKSGDVVILYGDHRPRTISLFFALYENNNIIIPQVEEAQTKYEALLRTCAPQWASRVSDDHLDASEVEAHGAASQEVARLQQENHAGIVLLSSGTTGQPKIMLHDLDQWVTKRMSKRCRPRLRMLMLLLFDHIGGLNSLINAVSGGNVVVIPKSRRVEDIVDCLEQDKVSVLPTSPSFLNLLSISIKGNDRRVFPGVRLVTYGSESMPSAVLRTCKAIFPNAKFQETYGLSELGILGTRSKSGAGSDMFYIDEKNAEYKIVYGELVVRKSTSFYGYLNRDNSDTEWFYTGDLVEVDEDNALKIVGRKDDIITVGGEKVFPLEVESNLLEVEEVQECRVYGESCPIMGQTVSADVVPTDAVSYLDLIKTIHVQLRQSLQSYKIPQKINVVEKIGLTDRLKLERRKA